VDKSQERTPIPAVSALKFTLEGGAEIHGDENTEDEHGHDMRTGFRHKHNQISTERQEGQVEFRCFIQ
jgi:hypothetical protein